MKMKNKFWLFLLILIVIITQVLAIAYSSQKRYICNVFIENSFVNQSFDYSLNEIEILNELLFNQISKKPEYREYDMRIFMISAAVFNIEIKSNNEIISDIPQEIASVLLEKYRKKKIADLAITNSKIPDENSEYRKINQANAISNIESMKITKVPFEVKVPISNLRIHIVFLSLGLALYLFVKSGLVPLVLRTVPLASENDKI